MDRQLLERMVGAAVLILALVVIAPAILDGPGDGDRPVPLSEPSAGQDVKTVTIRPDTPASQPPVATRPPPTPPPAESAVGPADAPAPEAKPAAAPEPAPKPVSPPPRPAPAPAPAPEPAPEPERGGWAVQLGSFANQANARRLAGEVDGKGFEAYLRPLQRDGRTLYRVRVGPRPDREAAAALLGELRKLGYQGQVTPEEPGS